MKHKNLFLVAFLLTLFVFQQAQASSVTSSVESPSKMRLASANANILSNSFSVYVYKLVPQGQVNSGSILPVPDPLCSYPTDIQNPVYGCGDEYPDPDLGGIQNPPGTGPFIVSEEYYLKNVLPPEMNFDQISPELEALKAQAVAARTFANWWGPVLESVS